MASIATEIGASPSSGIYDLTTDEAVEVLNPHFPSQLSAEGIGQSVQFHGVQFLDGLLVQHVGSFKWGRCRRYCTSLVGGL